MIKRKTVQRTMFCNIKLTVSAIVQGLYVKRDSIAFLTSYSQSLMASFTVANHKKNFSQVRI